MFWLRNKKNSFSVRTLIWRPGYFHFSESGIVEAIFDEFLHFHKINSELHGHYSIKFVLTLQTPWLFYISFFLLLLLKYSNEPYK